MKLFILVVLALSVVTAEENYDGPEWAPIDFSNVFYPHELPDFHQKFHPKITAGQRSNRITGGDIAVPHSHPYQTAQFFTITGNVVVLCGGSIVNQRTILTAAHCMRNTQDVLIIAGAHSTIFPEPSQQRRTVLAAHFVIHPEYDRPTLLNDIAVIQIAAPVAALSFTPEIQPIVFPRGVLEYESFAGERGQTTGWGRVNQTGPTSVLLRVVENYIITNAECAAVYGESIANENVICIETVGGRGPCTGDSGGVLSVVRNGVRIQVGVTSFGAGAGCDAGLPAGFERVSRHTSFIDNNTLAP